MPDFIVPLTSPAASDASRFGPKAANLAALSRAGLPTPGGFCVDAATYRAQVEALGLGEAARGAFSSPDIAQARRCALAMKLGLLEQPIVPSILEPLLCAWQELRHASGCLVAVRSSALVEDRAGSSFAGQFESFIGIESETDFLTAVRSCWAALWSTRALRYMATHDLDPADTAMGLIIQPLVAAHASGGGLSQTADGDMLLSATWGLGSAIAQGEVTPDRYELGRNCVVKHIHAGRKDHRVGCVHREEPVTEAVPAPLVMEPCLSAGQAAQLGGLLLETERLMGMPVEIEWALDDGGFKMLQARPLHTRVTEAPDGIWVNQPRLTGHPAGVGWGSGRACVINCECELSRVGPGDVLVTRVASPALSHILPQVAGVVAERGGSTSHMASLARERGIPMVLGVPGATERIPEGATVAVDGVAGVVRWMRQGRDWMAAGREAAGAHHGDHRAADH